MPKVKDKREVAYTKIKIFNGLVLNPRMMLYETITKVKSPIAISIKENTIKPLGVLVVDIS